MHRFLRCSLLAGLMVMASAATAADLLVENVNGYTLDKHGQLQRFDALLIDHGKVVAIGGKALLLTRADGARIENGLGRTLLPGLIDAHGHVMDLGYMKTQANLVSTTSLGEAQRVIKSYAAQHPGAGWIQGGGWNQVIWKLGRFPNASELDAAISDRPAWLTRVDGHAGWANSAAMKLAGIRRNTRDPAGGRIERDAQGNPTGVFVDGAQSLIESHIPAPSGKQREAALDAALAEMRSVGMTGVDDAGIDAKTCALYLQYADAHRLTTRVYAMIRDTGADFDRISKKGPLIGYGDDFLTVRAVKLFSDGALGSRGAAMLAPYSDDPHNRGLLFHPPAELTAMIGKALAKGYQVNIHAIGDRANREVLDSFEAAYKLHGGENLRNRVEHAQILAPSDIPRFVQLKLVASMQPTHATSDMNMAEDRIGVARLQGAYAWQTFLKQGTVIAGGSDFPVESPNPFYGLHAAITRQDHHDQPPGGWYPGQAMTRIEAFRAFTLSAAWAAHEEKTQGSLEPGKWADFIVIDRDIFSIPAKDIWSTKVLQTWVGGKLVYAAAH